MKCYSLPFPNAYSRNKARYTFIDPATGRRYEYIAGQDGIDEQRIEIIKEEDRKMNAAYRRFQRWRKRDEASGYVRTVISLEEISMNDLEKSRSRRDADADADAEQMLIRQYDALAFEQDYTQALSSLSEGMQAAWVLYTKYDLSINDIAQHLKLPYGTVKKRIQRTRKYFQEKLRCHRPQCPPID